MAQDSKKCCSCSCLEDCACWQSQTSQVLLAMGVITLIVSSFVIAVGSIAAVCSVQYFFLVWVALLPAVIGVGFIAILICIGRRFQFLSLRAKLDQAAVHTDDIVVAAERRISRAMPWFCLDVCCRKSGSESCESICLFAPIPLFGVILAILALAIFGICVGLIIAGAIIGGIVDSDLIRIPLCLGGGLGVLGGLVLVALAICVLVRHAQYVATRNKVLSS